MSQLGEAISALFKDDEPEQDPDKTGIKIRISLFYDGTLNNRNNIKVREAAGDPHSASGNRLIPDNEVKYDKNNKKLPTKLELYEKNRDPSGPNSYDNGRTNINIMEAQVLDEADGYDHYLKFYIEGQGTFNDKGDSLAGYSMGSLSSGVPRRATKGIVSAVATIKEKLEKSKPEYFYIQELTIDVFGFSRGAATARQSIHQMIKSTLRPMYARLRGIGYNDTRKSAVKVCFAGLYDTVLSYWLGQYIHTEWLLDMKAVTEAQHVLHLAASDEHRIDFPVSNINSAKANGGEEYFLPGVHSDVGGSYNLALDLSSQQNIVADKKEYMRTTSEKDRVLNQGTNKEELEADRLNILARGWYEPHNLIVKETRAAIPPTPGGPRGNPGRPAQYQLIANRTEIHSAYCNIPLKIMADYAKKYGIQIHADLVDVANHILSAEKDLVTLEEKILAYVNPGRGTSTDFNSKSKPEDWLEDESIIPIRFKHFNFSSKTGAGYSPRMHNGIRTRYEVNA